MRRVRIGLSQAEVGGCLYIQSGGHMEIDDDHLDAVVGMGGIEVDSEGNTVPPPTPELVEAAPDLSAQISTIAADVQAVKAAVGDVSAL